MDCEYSKTTDFVAFMGDSMAPDWQSFRDHYPTCRSCSSAIATLTQLATLLEEDGDGASMRHPNDESLLAFAQRLDSISQPQRSQLEAHLRRCIECRGTVAMLNRYDISDILVPVLREDLKSNDGSSQSQSLFSLWISKIREHLSSAPTWQPAAMLAVMALLALLVKANGSPSGWIGLFEESPQTMEQVDTQSAASGDEIAFKFDQQTDSPNPMQEAKTRSESQNVVIAAPTTSDTPDQNEATENLLALASLGPPGYHPPDPLEEIIRSRSYRAIREQLVAPIALAPKHVGYTLAPSPSLFWFAPPGITRDVELLLVAEKATDPLVKTLIEPPIRAGIHELSLKSLSISLEPDVTYHWFVTIWFDDRSERLRSGGAIRRIAPSKELTTILSSKLPVEQGHILAANGIWYDSFDFFSGMIKVHPHDPSLPQQRGALLEQIEILDVARHQAPSE